MGTTSPINSSGISICKGKLIIKGPAILIKDTITIAKNNQPIKLFLPNLYKRYWPNAINMHPNMDAAIMDLLLTKLVNFVSNAC